MFTTWYKEKNCITFKSKILTNLFLKVRAADEARANSEVGVHRTDEDYSINESVHVPGEEPHLILFLLLKCINLDSLRFRGSKQRKFIRY